MIALAMPATPSRAIANGPLAVSRPSLSRLSAVVTVWAPLTSFDEVRKPSLSKPNVYAPCALPLMAMPVVWAPSNVYAWPSAVPPPAGVRFIDVGRFSAPS